MLAEWNVELAADDPALEVPWSSEDGRVRFFDLKRQPELLLEIPEACFYSELAQFLSWANSSESPFETAKCDAWTSRKLEAEEEIFGEACKFGSYVDLLFVDPASRSQLSLNEKFVQGLARLLRHAPEMASAAEFTLRRCQDHRAESRRHTDCFYITFYLNGYGEDEQQARKRWAIALNMAQNAMIQYFATRSGIC
jgi:hypothetical protein